MTEAIQVFNFAIAFFFAVFQHESRKFLCPFLPRPNLKSEHELRTLVTRQPN